MPGPQPQVIVVLNTALALGKETFHICNLEAGLALLFNWGCETLL